MEVSLIVCIRGYHQRTHGRLGSVVAVVADDGEVVLVVGGVGVDERLALGDGLSLAGHQRAGQGGSDGGKSEKNVLHFG